MKAADFYARFRSEASKTISNGDRPRDEECPRFSVSQRTPALMM